MVKLNINKKTQYIWLIIISLVLVLVLIIVAVFGKKKYSENQWDKAREAYKLTNYAEVVSLVGKISVPDNQSDKSLLAHSYLAIDDKENALKLFSDLGKVESNVDAKLMEGNILRDLGKTKEAEEKYKEINRINTGYIQAYLNLASMYQASNQLELANDTLTEAIKYNPNAEPVIKYWLSINESQKGSDEYKKWEARSAALNAVMTSPAPASTTGTSTNNQ